MPKERRENVSEIGDAIYMPLDPTWGINSLLLENRNHWRQKKACVRTHLTPNHSCLKAFSGWGVHNLLSNILLSNENWEKAVTAQHRDMVTVKKILLRLVWQTVPKNAALWTAFLLLDSGLCSQSQAWINTALQVRCSQI